jgi:hypothetical protein
VDGLVGLSVVEDVLTAVKRVYRGHERFDEASVLVVCHPVVVEHVRDVLVSVTGDWHRWTVFAVNIDGLTRLIEFFRE